MDIYINLTRQSRHFDITFIASSVQGAVLSFNISLITLLVNLDTKEYIILFTILFFITYLRYFEFTPFYCEIFKIQFYDQNHVLISIK